MSNKARSQLMILCEDKAQLDFIKGYCKEAGWDNRAIISQDLCPAGSQSAEQWVRERFERTLRTFRGKYGQGRSVILLVMIDGDKFSVSERKKQLQQNVQCTAQEPVALFVPKRNIQSWMAFLDGDFENEEKDYKQKYQRQSPNSKYGRNLRKFCLSSSPEKLPSSLEDACKEWEKIERV